MSDVTTIPVEASGSRCFGWTKSRWSGVQYVVTGTCRRLSEAEQRASGRKYVVTTDGNQVGGVREGALQLGDE